MQDKSPITKFRELRGCTLEEFGKMLSPPVDKSTVLRWERGTVPMMRVASVIAATGIPVEALRPDVAGLLKAKPKRRAEREST